MKDPIVYPSQFGQNSFDHIYVVYYPRMIRFAREYILQIEDAENIVQDIFLSLWEKREVLEVKISLTAYLFTLVRNRCLNFLRHQAIKDEFSKEFEAKRIALEELNHSFSSDEDIETIVNEAINKLPERCKAIFIKSRIEGKKYKEIAEELDVSVNTVENQIAIALRKLRLELKDYLPLLLFLLDVK
ncbi:MAG: RNA polymerase sigma-70 factor [Tannerella sp.]|jgi:RNA polymerase sigma-70 factor (ECF subfamily)|nr:RNA polymerase sigma-70 factor [Tannerella sp.]